MRRILFIVLSSVILFSCSDNASGEAKQANTTPNVQPRKVGELKIAYYDLDSLQMSYSRWKEADSISRKREADFQGAREKKYREVEQYRMSIAEKQQKGLLSQNDLQNAAANIQQKEASVMQWEQQEGMRIQEELADISNTLSNRVKQFAKEFCEANNIDILLVHAEFGSQIGYIGSEMNVTSEFIAYVNQKDAELLK